MPGLGELFTDNAVPSLTTLITLLSLSHRPFIDTAWTRPLEEDDAHSLVPDSQTPSHLHDEFQRVWRELEEKKVVRWGPFNRTTLTLILLWWKTMASQLLFCAIETCCRIAAPILLFYLLQFLLHPSQQPAWQGWLLALGISLTAIMMLIHHVLYFLGYRMGILQRLQVTTAIHAKLLRLNSASVATISAGQIINLISNDARRFDDYGCHLPFLIFGPLELLIVLLLVSLKLGIVPAIAGLGFTLLVFPIQFLLASFVASTRRSTAAQTDERVRLTGEIISGALSVKLLSWELRFAEILDKLRNGEATFLHHMNRVRTLNTSLLFLLPPIVSFVTFAVYRGLGNTQLDVPTVFSVLALFQLPRTSLLLAFTFAVQSTTELWVSLSRINDFLLSPEPPTSTSKDSGDNSVAFSLNSLDSYSWTLAEPNKEEDQMNGTKYFMLSDIGLTVYKGCLLGVTGDVGAGKSSLLSILLGDLLPHPREGSEVDEGPMVKGGVAYCSQVPWIISGTIRENILFGLPFKQDLYVRVLEACALDTDLLSLSAGDETELGERGINLSGGQKARISLARALFSERSTVLLDDVLAAVDSRVGKILFERAIQGELGGKTRVLVTHQRHVLPHCDLVLVLRKGRKVGFGTWDEVQSLDLPELDHMDLPSTSVDELSEQMNQDVKRLKAQPSSEDSEIVVLNDEPGQQPAASVIIHITEDDKPDLSPPPLSPPPAKAGMSRILSRTRTFNFFLRRPAPVRKQGGGEFVEDEQEAKSQPNGFFRGFSRRLTRILSSAFLSITDVAKKLQESDEDANAKGKLVKAEHRTEGDVSWGVYQGYCQRFGLMSMVFVCIFLFLGQAAYVASDWWLALWSRGSGMPQSDLRWVWSYGIIIGVLLILAYPRSALFFWASSNAASDIHHRMSRSVFRAPLSFFHQNPTGRILNRFSRDLSIIDDTLPMTVFDTLQCALLCLGAFVLVSIAVPVIIPFFIPLIWIFYIVRQRYVVSSRNAKRFEATTRSPVYAFFGQTIKGLSTIRAYDAADRFQDQFLALLSSNGSWCYATIATARWVGFRLDLICSTMLGVAALLSVAVSSSPTLSVQPQLLGLALVYLMSIMSVLQWMVRQSAEVENNMTSVERLLEYSDDLPREPPMLGDEGCPLDPPADWPSSGSITFHEVTCVYRPGLPPCLIDVSFSIAAGTSCGLVGRTGSGKSSLMLALFRLINVTSGRVTLDGRDAAQVPLDRLRGALSIIPQDPTLFSGSVRSNLDPWNLHSDSKIWDALGSVQLAGVVRSLKDVDGGKEGLESRMSEGGESTLSVGQRQLFCLARALLQESKVLCLDEATANVDSNTDRLIQGAIRGFIKTQGSDRILLVIAHRLDTIIDLDKTLVLGGGRVLEDGEPGELVQRPNGVFASMVSASRLKL